MSKKSQKNLSDESIVEHWKQNPYFQYFCGLNVYQASGYIQADETTLQVLNEKNKSTKSKSYIWLKASTDIHPIVLMHYAFEHMLHNKIDPVAFSSIMDKMSKYMQNDNDVDEDSMEYISTHPKTILRTQRAKLYSECFKKGDLECEAVKTAF